METITVRGCMDCPFLRRGRLVNYLCQVSRREVKMEKVFRLGSLEARPTKRCPLLEAPMQVKRHT